MEQLGGVLLEDQFGVATSRREALLSFLGDINANYANLDQNNGCKWSYTKDACGKNINIVV